MFFEKKNKNDHFSNKLRKLFVSQKYRVNFDNESRVERKQILVDWISLIYLITVCDKTAITITGWLFIYLHSEFKFYVFFCVKIIY